MNKYLPRWMYLVIGVVWGYIQWQILRGNPDPGFRIPILWFWGAVGVFFLAYILYHEYKRYRDKRK